MNRRQAIMGALRAALVALVLAAMITTLLVLAIWLSKADRSPPISYNPAPQPPSVAAHHRS